VAGLFIYTNLMQIPHLILKWVPYGLILLVYAIGANLDIMEVDAAQYASISLEMLKSGEYLQVLDRFEDYLDKPPLLFWLSALSMKLFGIGSWQYKLPSILFSLLGVFSTYKLGKRLYSEEIGRHASWILGCSFTMIMINNDIKTDTILVSAIVLAIWLLVSYIETKQWKFLIGSSVGIAIAMLTKGPIGLMMPALAIGGHVLLKRQWKSLFDWRWGIMFILVGIMLIPMCIGLYRQYGNEGLEFYFWTQSFGRITGENEWRNDASPFYFTHIFLWSFLPWTLLGIAGVASEFRNIRASISRKNSELYLLSGIALVWAALSFSKFKLPHYIFVVYPLIAILTAKFIHQLRNFVHVAWAQLILSVTACFTLAGLLLYSFPNGGWWVPVLLLLICLVAILYFFMSLRTDQIMIPSFLISIAIGIGLNLHFYPQLLPYQANSQVGKWVKENQVPEDKFFSVATGGRSLDFYAGGVVFWAGDVETAMSKIDTGVVLYANQDRYADLLERGSNPKRVIVFDNFAVQKLTIPFLNPKTRKETLKKNYLLFY